MLIIGATAWIAGQSSREARQRELNAQHQLRWTIAMLARNYLDAVDALLQSCPPHMVGNFQETFLRSYVRSDFDIPMDGLAAVPLHQIGDAALITAILVLRGIMGRTKKALDDALRDPVSSQTWESIRAQRTPTFNAVASVLRIVEGHAADRELSRLAGLA